MLRQKKHAPSLRCKEITSKHSKIFKFFPGEAPRTPLPRRELRAYGACVVGPSVLTPDCPPNGIILDTPLLLTAGTRNIPLQAAMHKLSCYGLQRCYRKHNQLAC